MDQERLLSAVVALLIALGGSAALALDPLGPPLAGPAAGQFQFGADVLYGGNDIEVHDQSSSRVFEDGVFQPDQSSSDHGSSKWGNVPTSKLYANLGYGIFQNWEVFLRVGGADNGMWADTLLAVGGGTKVTFYETGNWSFGGIAQLSWMGWEWEYESGTGNSTGSTEASVTEAQVALGACYRFSPHFSLYGGPFATYYEGTSDSESVTISDTRVTFSDSSTDTDVDAWFGGYVGLRMQLHEKAVASLEYQYTPDAYAFAASVVYRFGESR